MKRPPLDRSDPLWFVQKHIRDSPRFSKIQKWHIGCWARRLIKLVGNDIRQRTVAAEAINLYAEWVLTLTPANTNPSTPIDASRLARIGESLRKAIRTMGVDKSKVKSPNASIFTAPRVREPDRDPDPARPIDLEEAASGES